MKRLKYPRPNLKKNRVKNLHPILKKALNLKIRKIHKNQKQALNLLLMEVTKELMTTNDFIGKVCPYCKSPFKEGDDMAECQGKWYSTRTALYV